MASHNWSRLMAIWEVAKQYIELLIWDGNSSIWWENWTHEGCLISSETINFSSSIQHLRIKDAVDNQDWNLSLLSLATNFNSQCLQDLSPGLMYGHDKYIHMIGSRGSFSLKLALHCITSKEVSLAAEMNIWDFGSLSNTLSFCGK